MNRARKLPQAAGVAVAGTKAASAGSAAAGGAGGVKGKSAGGPSGPLKDLRDLQVISQQLAEQRAREEAAAAAREAQRLRVVRTRLQHPPSDCIRVARLNFS